MGLGISGLEGNRSGSRYLLRNNTPPTKRPLPSGCCILTGPCCREAAHNPGQGKQSLRPRQPSALGRHERQAAGHAAARPSSGRPGAGSAPTASTSGCDCPPSGTRRSRPRIGCPPHAPGTPDRPRCAAGRPPCAPSPFGATASPAAPGNSRPSPRPGARPGTPHLASARGTAAVSSGALSAGPHPSAASRAAPGASPGSRSPRRASPGCRGWGRARSRRSGSGPPRPPPGRMRTRTRIRRPAIRRAPWRRDGEPGEPGGVAPAAGRCRAP